MDIYATSTISSTLVLKLGKSSLDQHRLGSATLSKCIHRHAGLSIEETDIAFRGSTETEEMVARLPIVGDCRVQR